MTISQQSFVSIQPVLRAIQLFRAVLLRYSCERPELQECTRNVEEYGDEHSS